MVAVLARVQAEDEENKAEAEAKAEEAAAGYAAALEVTSPVKGC